MASTGREQVRLGWATMARELRRKATAQEAGRPSAWELEGARYRELQRRAQGRGAAAMAELEPGTAPSREGSCGAQTGRAPVEEDPSWGAAGKLHGDHGTTARGIR
ncbi:hypothetical protein ZEAMMB73_Zm00001d007540 [Zea mays]|jgi:hypothetical protein|uniref:Uncharacterized protein n=1 Tax=Zea mays TaxID=4577 RepID=A0A1D6F756_MAIZE|nr:hypothetical protein ZEAMMB73_Zm00001d007540 [Zea mays]